jgi:NAD(P) transhydrogenase subunit alpha
VARLPFSEARMLVWVPAFAGTTTTIGSNLDGKSHSLKEQHMDHIAQAVDPFVFRLSIFVLAVFVGYYVVWSVTPALHTPLMSVTNAISSVIVVGALLAVGVALIGNDSGPVWARALGFVALVSASVNIFGGFLVTQRMLAMYQKKKK